MSPSKESTASESSIKVTAPSVSNFPFSYLFGLAKISFVGMVKNLSCLGAVSKSVLLIFCMTTCGMSYSYYLSTSTSKSKEIADFLYLAMFSFATFLYLHNDKLLDVCTFQSAKKNFDIERDFSVSALD